MHNDRNCRNVVPNLLSSKGKCKWKSNAGTPVSLPGYPGTCGTRVPGYLGFDFPDTRVPRYLEPRRVGIPTFRRVPRTVLPSVRVPYRGWEAHM
eukprot:2940166-Rhodomonas_salina.2